MFFFQVHLRNGKAANKYAWKMPGPHWYFQEIYRNAQCNQTVPRVRRKNYLNAGQRVRRRHLKTIWYWDIEVVQNLKECTENLLSSGGAGGLPAGATHPLWTFVRKNRQMLEKQKDLQKQVDVPAFCSKYKKATFRTWKTSTKRSKWAERIHDTIESTSNAFLEDTEIVSASQAASSGIYCYRLYLFACFVGATKDTECSF